MSQPSLGRVPVPFPKVARTVEHRLEEVEEVIRAIVRSKLQVTLNRGDLRERNLDAFDLLGEIRLRLLRRCHSEGEKVDGSLLDLRAYAATVAFNGCADYFRRLYPERTRLQRCLRRALERSGDMDVRVANDGDWICGMRSWFRAKSGARDYPLREMPGTLPPSLLPSRHYGAFGPEEWNDLARGILKHLEGPVRLDDLVSVVAGVLGVKDFPSRDTEEGQERTGVRSGPGQYEFHLTRERLSLLWQAICELLPWHRIAYLLNMTDGEIDVFPYYGVATLSQIAEALSLDGGQYRLLYDRLGVDPIAPKGPLGPSASSLRLAGVWSHLPFQDNLIAEVLGVRRSQVIGYRAKALQRLKRRVASL